MTASSSLPSGGETAISATNTGTSGFASLYLQAPSETGQLCVGQATGLTMMTRTQHPISFKTFSDQTGVGVIPNSMQILGSGTRDVQVLAPFRCLGSLSTFDNSVSIGSALASSVNCLGLTGGATVGGTLAALGNVTVSGILRSPQIRVTGTDPNDGVIIQNVDGTEVAKFHNDFRCRMNGNTTVLGELTCSGNGSVAGILSCSSFKSSGVDGVSLVTNSGFTALRVFETGNVTIPADLTVSGTLNAGGLSYKPWHVAGRVDGATLQILSNKGEYPFTVSRPASYPLGIYLINWTQEHPDGANYVACCSGEGGGWNDLVNGVGAGFPTASGRVMNVAFRKLWQNGQAAQSEGLVDCPFSFFILK